MRGDPVGAGFNRKQRRANGVGTRPAARVADGGDVIDVDAEAKGLAHGPYLARGRQGCHVRASQRPYPIIRSTLLTSGLARSFDNTLVRCFRSATSRSK